MYRVNAERSQEKNDRCRRTQRCTKVTCATRTREKVRVTSQLTRSCCVWRPQVSEGTLPERLRVSESSGRFVRSIMKDYFEATCCLRVCLKDAQPNRERVEELNHGRF